MALVVFMRAVNVGGYQKFQPAALAKKLADLPVDQPQGSWGVRVIAVEDRFAMSLWRRLEGETMVYPNAVVEKKFGEAATTRSWNTIEAVKTIFESDEEE